MRRTPRSCPASWSPQDCHGAPGFPHPLPVGPLHYDMLDRSLPRFNETLQLPFYDTQAMERLAMPDHLRGRVGANLNERIARDDK